MCSLSVLVFWCFSILLMAFRAYVFISLSRWIWQSPYLYTSVPPCNEMAILLYPVGLSICKSLLVQSKFLEEHNLWTRPLIGSSTQTKLWLKFVWLLGPIRDIVHRLCPSRNFAWHISLADFFVKFCRKYVEGCYVQLLCLTSFFFFSKFGNWCILLGKKIGM